MSKIVNKLLVAGYEYMPEILLRQSGFSYRACAPFTKIKERRQKFKVKGDSQSIY